MKTLEKKSAEELQSRVINFLRFPLIVGVILIHTNFLQIINVDSVNYPFFGVIFHLFSNVLSGIAVPLFFFISGFLFFYKTTDFNASAYTQKLKKRFRTLFIPYVSWNAIYILIYFLAQTFASSFLSGKNKFVVDYSVTDWLYAFWDTTPINGITYPINLSLWFIRDLMVIVCLSPVIYFVVRKLKIYSVIALGILWICDLWFNVLGFSSVAVFFFSFGAYFSIHNKNFIVEMKPLYYIAGILYPIIVVVELYFFRENWLWIGYLHKVGVILGIITAFSVSGYFLSKKILKENVFLANSSFFIYAYHILPLTIVVRILFKFIPLSEMSLVVLYVVSPTIVILVGLFLYYILKKLLPNFTSIITGGR